MTVRASHPRLAGEEQSRNGTKPRANPVPGRSRAKSLAPEAESTGLPPAKADTAHRRPLAGLAASLFLIQSETPSLGVRGCHR